jgi:hypothetical protein
VRLVVGIVKRRKGNVSQPWMKNNIRKERRSVSYKVRRIGQKM